MARRGQAAADQTREERGEERGARGGHRQPERQAELFDRDDVAVEAHDLGDDRQLNERVEHALPVIVVLIKEGHQADQAREPAQDLEESVEPERTLEAELLEARQEHERNERHESKEQREHKR